MKNRVDPQKWEDAVATLKLISELLEIDRPLLALDIEATGQYPETDRVVEIYQLKMLPTGETYSGHYLINPGIPISLDASEIHKLTTEEVCKLGLRFNDIALGLWATMEDSILVGYNLGVFDQPILKAEFQRCHLAHDPTRLPAIDPYKIWAFMKRRTLSDAYEEFVGDKLTDAHRASDDVFATLDILHSQLHRFADKLPKNAAGLSEFCLGRQEDYVDSEGKFRWRDGVAICAFGSKAKGLSLQEIVKTNSGYLHWILRSEFKEDLKEICRNALKGIFPSRTKEPDHVV
jgi:DNA polymerase III subunit epsilon